MKKFVNKETEIVKEVKEGQVKVMMGYADLALIGLNGQPKEGWDFAIMRKRIKTIDKMEKLAALEFGKSIDLEDAEFDTVIECSNIKWAMFHRDLIAYDDYLQGLKK